MQEQTKELKLDLACGQCPRPGFVGVDIWEGADIVCNLEQYPWPFEDNSVDEIFCSHYIEHVPDLISFANELYRIMKVGAKAELIAPYYSSIRAWQDPTHVRAISENTFLYFSKEWREMNKLDHYPIYGDFECQCTFALHHDFQGKSRDEIEFARTHYINVVNDIRAVIVKKDPYCQAAQLERQAQDAWEEERYQEAAALSRAAIEAGAASEEILVISGDTALQQEQFEAALSAFRAVLERYPQSMQGHSGVLRSLKGLGLEQEAARHLAAVKAQDPDLADLLELVAG